MDLDGVSYLGEPWATDELFGQGRWNVARASHSECVKVPRLVGGDLGRTAPVALHPRDGPRQPPIGTSGHATEG